MRGEAAAWLKAWVLNTDAYLLIFNGSSRKNGDSGSTEQ
jgi:hypothetical protein